MSDSNLVKKISRVEEYLFGLKTYLNNRDMDSFGNLVSRVALTALTVSGALTIISEIAYHDPWKYVFGSAAIGCSEVFRLYVHNLIKKENV